jgi:protoheme IX farnesyltransferase
MTLAFVSVVTLGILVNWIAAALLAFTIFFYVVIYTIWLKRITAQNIVIGGAAGALPPVVAWACVTGSLAIEPMLLFAIIFFWTPPHFWALALFRAGDYANAGVPMLPVTAGPDATRLSILLYTIVLVAVALAPWPLGYFSAVYGITSLALGGGMLALALRIYRDRHGSAGLRASRNLFRFSILYLFALFAVLLLEVVARSMLARFA